MKRKISIIKVISILLSICLLVSSNLTAIEVFAYEVNVSSSDDEATREAKEDSKSKKLKAGNWKEAHYEEGLPWNYFHNTVQKDIRDNHSEFERNELSVTKQNGKLGRVDIWNYIDNDEKDDFQTAYYWEVKPGSYLIPDKMIVAKSQLNQYILGTPNSPYTILEKKIGGELGKSILSFNKLAALLGSNTRLKNDIELFLCFDDTGRYAILYAYMGNGIILYWFAKADIDNGKPKFNPNAFSQIFSAAFWAALYKYSQNMNTGQNPSGPTPVPADYIPEEYIEYARNGTKNLIGYDNMSDYVSFLLKENEKSKKVISDNIDESSIINDPDKVYVSEELLLTVKNAADVICENYVKPGFLELFAVWAFNYTSVGELYDVSLGLKTALASMSTMKKITLVGAAAGTYYAIDKDLYENIEEFLGLWETFSDRYTVYDEDGIETINPEDIELTTLPVEDQMNKIKAQHTSFSEAEKTVPQRDPLIIDLGNDDIDLTNVENGVYFDLDNNGYAEKTAWIGEEDGFLALDVNGNGIIDNGGELFGDKFIMPDGNVSRTGSEALSSLDENDDGVINADDTVFESLFIWVDADHDGETDEGEFLSLTEYGIESIDLNFTPDGTVNTETGTMIAESSFVSFGSDNTRKISEFWFPVNSADTTHDGEATVGNVPNFEQALADDLSGELLNLYIEFSYADSISQKRYYLKKILYYITDADEIEPESRGGNIDARDLHVIESFMGREFEGVDGSNPNSRAAEILKTIYNNIENYYYTIVNMHSGFGQYMFLFPETEDENGLKSVYTDAYDDYLKYKIYNGENIDILLYDLGNYLKSFDSINGTNEFDKYRQCYSLLSEHCSDVVELVNNTYTYIGTNGNDKVQTENRNTYVCGQGGDDIYHGSVGNDLYFFDIYHGNDVIYDKDGSNTVEFSSYLPEDSYSVSVDPIKGFVLTNEYTDATISMPDFLTDPQNYSFIFNATSEESNYLNNRNIIEGTDEDDYYEPGDGFNIFYGNAGNDTLAGGKDMDFMYGGAGDDTLLGRNGINVIFGEGGIDTIYDGDDGSYLSGGESDDFIYGGGGADVLDGGSGNDYLQGDHGGDTYIYRKGYDIDTINASSDDNTILIYGYRANQMINTRNVHNDLIIHFGSADSTDCLVIDHFFDYNSNRDIKFVFEDGTVLGQLDITAKYEPIVGTDDNDWLSIHNGDNGNIHAGAGNDGLSGGSGNDELYGEDGDDTLYGNDGNDVLDGGTGIDTLCGGNGEDTYVFAKGYEQDTINEWGSDHSIILFTDINSDEITVSDQWGSNLLISVNDTDDVLTISNFKWGQTSYTFKFADGAEGYVDKDTWQLILTKQPDVVEEEIDDSVNCNEDTSLEETTEAEKEISSDEILSTDTTDSDFDTTNDTEDN